MVYGCGDLSGQGLEGSNAWDLPLGALYGFSVESEGIDGFLGLGGFLEEDETR